MFRRIQRPVFLSTLVAVWAMGVATGFVALWLHAYTPTVVAAPLGSSPPARVATDGQTGLVRVFAHPFCPCFNDTLEALTAVQARVGSRVRIEVVFVWADPSSHEIDASTSIRTASKLPGATVHYDTTGSLAAAYQAVSSGHLVFHDAAGVLRFQGGITTARGHAGSTVAREQLIDLIETPHAGPLVTTPIFGCPLIAQ